MTRSTLDFITAWVARQYGNRLCSDGLAEVARRMLDEYNEDPQLWGNAELRRLADTVGADELARTLERL